MFVSFDLAYHGSTIIYVYCVTVLYSSCVLFNNIILPSSRNGCGIGGGGGGGGWGGELRWAPEGNSHSELAACKQMHVNV